MLFKEYTRFKSFATSCDFIFGRTGLAAPADSCKEVFRYHLPAFIVLSFTLLFMVRPSL
jgi:hypothetical protein